MPDVTGRDVADTGCDDPHLRFCTGIALAELGPWPQLIEHGVRDVGPSTAWSATGRDEPYRLSWHRGFLALPLALPAACSLFGRLQTIKGLTPGCQDGTVTIGMRELS
jgi:hypothetical protein